ncbi:CPBP family intramembrane glutamic endopeptidase [Lachnospiraceae bacterium 54-53]
MISIVLHLILPVFFYTTVTGILFQGLGTGALEAAALSALLTSPVLFSFYAKDQRLRGMVPAAGLRLHGCLVHILVFGGALCVFGNLAVNALGLAAMSPAYEEAAVSLYSPPLAVQLAASGFVIPITEELIFRGMIFASLRDRLPFLLSAVLSAALFGLYHGNLPQGVYAFLIGMAVAWLYEVCKTLLAPCLFHVSANVLSICVTNTSVFGPLTGSDNQTVISATAAVSALVSAICAIRIYRKNNKKEDIV